ncbi:MAG TPA: hypothetical protein VL049_11235 [Candidatus Dormibacteraeota bacterium]|nr:hypothetical protein [Candidatus Dormibacteraeota bacterium]
MKRLFVVSLGGFFVVVTAAMAHAETITGEVVDTFCYTAMGAKGATHRQCGLDCAKKGIPIGLLENGTNKLYVLLPTKDKTAVPEAAVNKMGEQATITGKMYNNGGSTFLTVDSVK